MKKRGFTLIELLAVIVILAILALIAIPITIKIISDSRENANKQSIANYAKAVEEDIVSWTIEDTSRQFADYEAAYKNREIKVTGDKVACEKATVDKEGELTLSRCYLVKYESENNKKYYDYIVGKVYESESDEALVSAYAKQIEDNYEACKQNSEVSDYLQCALNKINDSKIECSEKSVNSEGKAVLKGCYRKDTEESKRKYYNYENGKISKLESSGSSTNGTSGGNSTSGTTPYVEESYDVGKEIIFKNESYRIIVVGSDYLTLLKSKLLTKQEIDNSHYGQGYINKNTTTPAGEVYDDNDYGGVAYYSSATCGCSIPGNNHSGNWSGCKIEDATNYKTSDVKHVVDDWAADKFSSNELKEVYVTGYGNYKARLATKEELQPIGWPNCSKAYCDKENSMPSWIWNSSYNYWTMSKFGDDEDGVWKVIDDGRFTAGTVFFGVTGGVRPVINVYKSAIPN